MCLLCVQLFPSDKQKNPYTKKIDKTPTDYNGTLKAVNAHKCLPVERASLLLSSRNGDDLKCAPQGQEAQKQLPMLRWLFCQTPSSQYCAARRTLMLLLAQMTCQKPSWPAQNQSPLHCTRASALPSSGAWHLQW